MVALVNYSWLSKCCTARESSYRFSLVGLTKVKARKYFLFTENFTCIENKEHLLDFVITFILQHFASMLYPVVKCHNQLLPYWQYKANRSFSSKCDSLANN